MEDYNGQYTGEEIDTLLGEVAGKQDKISDLETIRAGAAKGETALQSVPKGYATEDYVDLEVTTLWEVVDQKQDILQDNVNIKTINDESILGKGNITFKQSQSNWTETNSSSDSYIKNKPTFKTINGENILGAGDVAISAAYPISDHGNSGGMWEIDPNVFHVWGNVASLSLTFKPGADGVANEYLFQFSCLGGEVTTLGLPEGIMWANGEVPTLEVLKTYQVSILNNCATIQSFG